MIRNIDLINYLPPYLKKYREIQAITDSENPEFQLIADDSEVIKDNMFISYTDESGIERYEKMFGIIPSANHNLHERQINVLSHYTNAVKYTLNGLIERLDIICGVGNYTLVLIPDEYKINVVFNLRVKNLINAIDSISTDMIPANMLFQYVIEYNTHEILANYPNYLLMQFRHQELRNLVIEDNISTICDDVAEHTAEVLKSISCDNVLKYGIRKV